MLCPSHELNVTKVGFKLICVSGKMFVTILEKKLNHIVSSQIVLYQEYENESNIATMNTRARARIFIRNQPFMSHTYFDNSINNFTIFFSSTELFHFSRLISFWYFRMVWFEILMLQIKYLYW